MEFKLNKKIILIVFGSIIIISFLSAFIYGNIKQRIEYKKWLEESHSQEVVKTGDFGLLVKKGAEESLKDDLNSQFIKDYYHNIEQKNFDKAYKMSKQTVDLNTFISWYSNVDKITIDKMIKIDENKSSLELTLNEGNVFTKYNVLMTLLIENGVPKKIEKSEVKIIENTPIESQDNDSFFTKNSNTKLFATNQEFSDVIKNGKDKIVILDARENIEYENGYMPGSLHIRFADLKAGRWIELPNNKIVYVLCWSGIRGEEVTHFLRSKGILAKYIEKGASDWVAFGGEWFGNIKFVEKYSEYRFQRVMTTTEVKGEMKNGAVLVDCREPDKYNQSHISGSINIPTMYIPSVQYEEIMAQVPKNSKVIAICDAYVNCFDAKITGVELEKRGSTLLGRYNKPWEYEK